MIIEEKRRPSELSLNPGRPKRKRGSGTGFLLGFAGLIVGCLVLYWVWDFGNRTYELVSFSHQSLYQNQTLDQVQNRSTVVRPLIDTNQTFDLAISVWLKRTQQERFEYWDQRGDVSELAGLMNNMNNMSLNSRWWHYLQTYDQLDWDERPVFSDIVFRNLTLKDKHVFRDVNFSIPTALFREIPQNVWNLRGSVYLIPHSPSLLDHLHSFSTWRPTYALQRTKSYPFPLNSTDYTNHTHIDDALDTISITFPLLQLLEIPSQCSPSSSTPQSSSEEEDDPEFVFAADSPEQYYQDANTWNRKEQILKQHPFIVTRTQLRLVDETHLFNRKAYDKRHQKLISTSCGRDSLGAFDINRCERSYSDNGHWETRLELGVPGDDGELRTEYAYAPYLSSLKVPLGPLDLLRVPITRENCTNSNSNSSSHQDQEWMDITWHISYTGRTPGKFVFAETLGTPQNEIFAPGGMASSDYRKSLDHNAVEILHGLVGHKFHERAHPRRRAIVSFIGVISGFFPWILDMHYWYTCPSTVSLSVPGWIMVAISHFLYAVVEILNQKRLTRAGSAAPLFWTCVRVLITNVLSPLLIFRAIMRIEFRWLWWFPWFGRHPPTHAERANERLEARTPAIARLWILTTLATLFYLLSPSDIYLVSPTLPRPTAEDYPPNPIETLTFSLEWTGLISQIILNQRTQVYAGSYKVTVFLRVLDDFVAILYLIPPVLGPVGTNGISVYWVMWLVLQAATAYQAMVFPGLNSKDEDETSQ